MGQWPPDGSLAGHPGAPARHPGLQELFVTQQLEGLLYSAAPAVEAPHQLFLLGQRLAWGAGTPFWMSWRSASATRR